MDLEDNGFGASSDPWGNSQQSATGNQQPKQYSEFESGSDELFPPLNSFNPNNNGATTQKPAQQVAADPWGLSNGSNNNTTDPWQSPSGTNGNNNPMAGNNVPALDDPWASTTSPQQQQQQPAKLDEFDLFTNNRAVNQSPLTTTNTTAHKPTPPTSKEILLSFLCTCFKMVSHSVPEQTILERKQKLTGVILLY